MNPTEIYDALDTIAKTAFDPTEFPFVFAEGTVGIPVSDDILCKRWP